MLNGILIVHCGVNPVVSKYLRDNEEAVVARELKIDDEIYFIVYEVYRGGQPTGDFLIFDVKKKAVVGGLERFYPPEDIREIASFNLLSQTIDSKELRQSIDYYDINFKSGLELLKAYGETIGPEWSKDVFTKKVIKELIVYSALIIGAALVPGAQMTIPLFLAQIALTATAEFFNLMDIMRTLEGNDENFLPYHTTLSFLGLREDEKTNEYIKLLKNEKLIELIKAGIDIQKKYEIFVNYIPYAYAILRVYYEQPETSKLVVDALKIVGLSEDALKEGGAITKAVTTILRLGRKNEHEFYGALGASIRYGVVSDKIFKLGLNVFGHLLGLIFDHKVVRPTINMKTLIANGLLYSQLMIDCSQHFKNVYSMLFSNQLPFTESTFVKLWLSEYFYHYSLADFWNKIGGASENQIESLLSYDKKNEFRNWLKNVPINVLSAKDIQNEAKREEQRMLNKSILYLSRIAKLCSDVEEEYNKYREIMASRRKIASGLIKKEADIVLCLDVSGSMKAKLGNSTRINESKRAAEMFLNIVTHKGVKVGLVKFATTSTILSELTEDFAHLKSLIRGLSAEGSTAMGEGIFNSINVLSRGKSRSKNVILLTDGVSNTGRDPEIAAEEAENKGIKVFTIGMGDVATGEFNPELLKKIAEMTGGVYYEYDLSKGVSEDALWEIYMKIISSISEEKAINQFSSTIAQGEEQTYFIDIPSETSSFTTFLSYPGSRLQLELIDPESNTLSANDWNVVYLNDTGVEMWTVLNPLAGKWELKVRGITVTGRIPYVLTAQVPRLKVEPQALNVVFLNEREVVKVYLSEISGERDIKDLRIKVLPPLDRQVVQKEITLEIKKGETITLDIEFIKPNIAGIYSGTISIEYEGLEHNIPVTLKYPELHIAPIDLRFKYRSGAQVSFSVYVFSSDGAAVSHADVFLESPEGRLRAEEDDLTPGLYNFSMLCPKIKGDYYINLTANKTMYAPGRTSLLITIISIIGDLNYDGQVDYKDLAILISKYGSAKGEVSYLEDADINSDNKIDYKDLALLIAHYGEQS